MSEADVASDVLASGAVLSSLRGRLAECSVGLRRIYHDTRNAHPALNDIANEIQTSSLSLKLVERHARVQTHEADTLDSFIELWQGHTTSIEQLASEVFKRSEKPSLADNLYAAEQERGLHKLLEKLDRVQNALQEGIQLYHQEEQSRRWLGRHDHTASRIVRRDHGHDYSGIEVRDHARAQFGDTFYNGDVYITHHDSSSQQAVATIQPPTMRGISFVDREGRGAQDNEQIAAMEKNMRTDNAYITSQLSLILKQLRPEGTQSIGPGIIEESIEPVQEQEQASRDRARSRRSKRVFFRLKFRLPNLFSSRVWELARFDASQGWDLCFRTYHRRRNDAEVSEYCRQGYLKGVQKLISNGEASVLDVDEYGHNLLSMIPTSDILSSHGLMQWLLSQEVRLYGVELYEPLENWVIHAGSPYRVEQLLRIFLHDLDDPDADVDLRSLVWVLSYCQTPTSVDMLLKRCAGLIRNMSASELVNFALSTIGEHESAASLMRKIEICDGLGFPHGLTTLDFFCQVRGGDVLSTVAFAFGRCVTGSELDLWTHIGVTAIENGADPVAGSAEGGSPLLDLLSEATLPYNDKLSIEPILIALELWINMLKRANVDLRVYCLNESEALRDRSDLRFLSPPHIYFNTPEVVAIEYDDQTESCSLCILTRTTVPLRSLHQPPGSFTDQSMIPSTICWYPNKEESEEGFWLTGYVHLASETISLQSFVDARTDAYHGLVDSTQDDNGILMRVLENSCRSRRSRKRSSSQPGRVRWRRHNYGTRYHSKVHLWLKPLHFCMDTSTWVSGYHEEIRNCVNGDPLEALSAFGYYGFLDEVRACQIGFDQVGRELHEFTPQCPRNCAKLNLNNLAIPRSLPPWHPGRLRPLFR